MAEKQDMQFQGLTDEQVAEMSGGALDPDFERKLPEIVRELKGRGWTFDQFVNYHMNVILFTAQDGDMETSKEFQEMVKAAQKIWDKAR